MLFIKRSFYFILFILYPLYCFSLSITDLATFALESNFEIQTASNTYKTQIFSSKNLNGSYTPSLSLTTATTIPKDYDLQLAPNYLDSNIIYSQPLPGGTFLSIGVDYNFTALTINNDRYITQVPNISFSLKQSLLPFWIQGQKKDPVKLSFKQNEEYYYYQLLCTKKNVLIQLLQNYVYALISLNEIAVYKNLITFYEEEIESLKVFESIGNISKSSIIEVENSKWNTQQNLIAAQVNYATYIQTLKRLCGRDFDENLLEYSGLQNYEVYLIKILDEIIDPLGKVYNLNIQMIKTANVSEKQTSAPILNFSVKPEWILDSTTQGEWKSAWKDISTPSNWTFSLGIDFTPLFMASANQNDKKYQLKYKDAMESYNSFLKQKEFVKYQYEKMLLEYMERKEIISELINLGIQELNDCKIQYEAELISKLDYDSVRVKVENYGYSKSSIELYILLYNILIKVQ